MRGKEAGEVGRVQVMKGLRAMLRNVWALVNFWGVLSRAVM